jgi:hypothetical protein
MNLKLRVCICDLIIFPIEQITPRGDAYHPTRPQKEGPMLEIAVEKNRSS